VREGASPAAYAAPATATGRSILSLGVSKRSVGERGGGFSSGFLADGCCGFVGFPILWHNINQGHKSLFTFLFNTASAENELKCHFRKKIKFSCQNGKKKVFRAK
jgi:hypothetical protein